MSYDYENAKSELKRLGDQGTDIYYGESLNKKLHVKKVVEVGAVELLLYNMFEFYKKENEK